MTQEDHSERSLGFWGATGVGVGAIVGGGILALSGVAFANTGPSAILAFALNGLIALFTALSFAELASRFPQSGGTYTFAKKVLTIETAFAVGWVVWFASIVAAVLYAIGFGFFATLCIEQVWTAVTGNEVSWSSGRSAPTTLAVAATLFYTVSLVFRKAGGGQWTNIGKVVVFAVLITGGLWVLTGRTAGEIQTSLTPFLAKGGLGLLQAMGFTFIALQGFDLIAAVGGEVRDPQRTLPRAMLSSLGIALLIYLPLLFVITSVGTPAGQSIFEASRDDPEAIVALAAQNYLGSFGYWLVIIAAILSMLSALQANLFAASRVAAAMARDRTLPHHLGEVDKRRGIPVVGVLATSGLVVAILLVIPDVGTAGAAASLIFLLTFTLAHGVTILARRRGRTSPGVFQAPLYPLIPLAGGLACLALAVYGGVVVPTAGAIASAWLAVGAFLFVILFARRARLVDASTEAYDPEISRLRGRSPLVLVPIANPARAEGLVEVAHALSAPGTGRVLLLSVVTAEEDWNPQSDPAPLAASQAVLAEALKASVAAGFRPEALTTVAPQPWNEISRVARIHRCESLVLGLSEFSEDLIDRPIELLLTSVACDIVVVRAPSPWHLPDVRRVLVPLAGQGSHGLLLARLLGSLARTSRREITFLTGVGSQMPAREADRARRELTVLARDLGAADARAEVVFSDSVGEAIVKEAASHDLLVLGLQRSGRGRRAFGDLTLKIARETSCPLILISRRA